jgi:hypothetical protein
MDAFTYGLKPVPFRIFFLGRSFFGDPFQRFGTERSFEGLRPSFSATYARGEHGHPSRGRGLRLDGQILASSKITPLDLLAINEYLCDALH